MKKGRFLGWLTRTSTGWVWVRWTKSVDIFYFFYFNIIILAGLRKPLHTILFFRAVGLVVSQFLESNATQLTYHGLQLLMDSTPRGKLSVLFRNNHVSASK